MANAYDMIDVTQGKLKQLVREDRSGVGKSEQGVVCENSAQAHSPSMKDSFMAETAQARVAVDDVNLLADDNVPEDGEKGEDGRHCRLAVYNNERDVVDLEPIGKVSDPGAPFVCMGNDDHFVAAVNKFLRL